MNAVKYGYDNSRKLPRLSHKGIAIETVDPDRTQPSCHKMATGKLSSLILLSQSTPLTWVDQRVPDYI